MRSPTNLWGAVGLVAAVSIVMPGVAALDSIALAGDDTTTTNQAPYATAADDECTYARDQMERLAADLGLSPLSTTNASQDEADLVASGACQAMRDTALSYLWQPLPSLPAFEECGTFQGSQTCVAVRHEQCDVALVTFYSKVYVCLGGIFPDN